MPKHVKSTLIWSWEQGIYTLYEQGNLDTPLLQGDDEPWFVWLSFQHRVPLLAPKLQLPRLPSSLVERSRLFVRLDAGRMGKLTLLSAPAGFGKTMLVRQWVNDRMGTGNTHAPFPPLAWVTLDPNDNDPIRFWHYLISACLESIPEKRGTSGSAARKASKQTFL